MDNKRPDVAVVMRSFNDIDTIRETLSALMAQSYKDFELWNFDSTSTDGTLDVIREFNAPERILLNDSRCYNPGRILNEAVAATSGRRAADAACITSGRRRGSRRPPPRSVSPCSTVATAS